jgi:membrane fusion protein
MYDGFPYQRFGTQSGTIISISDAAISPGELAGPLQIQEPVFVAKVALDKGTITAYGEERPLQTDMLLTADIVQAKRSILDWILDPLYALRGRT